MESRSRVEILMLSILVEVMTKSRFEWLNFLVLRFVEARLPSCGGLFATSAAFARLLSKFHHLSRVTCSVFKSYVFWNTILGQNPRQQPLCSGIFTFIVQIAGSMCFLDDFSVCSVSLGWHGVQEPMGKARARCDKT